eukprot:4036910-Amphidinium_carterae.1
MVGWMTSLPLVKSSWRLLNELPSWLGGIWPPSAAQWEHPGQAGWLTIRGFVPWFQASATAAQDSQAWLFKQLALRRADFTGLEAGLDPVDLQLLWKLSNSATHAGRAACSAAAGGLWHAARIAE